MEFRVRYAETDAMGVVHHANYLVWFEAGRTELMRSWGIPYTEFERQGIFVPVIEAVVRYRSPARYDDLIRVEGRLQNLSAARVTFAYRIVRQADELLLCEGETTHAFMTPAGRPVALPRRAPLLWAALQSGGADSRTRNSLGSVK